MVKTFKILGWRWVTGSIGWMVLIGGFQLMGLLTLGVGIAALTSSQIDRGVGALIAVLSLFWFATPWFTTSGLWIGPTHLRRAPQNGRPTKLPLAEITEVWPVAHVQLQSPVGTLLDVRPTPFAFRKKGTDWFDQVGEDLARLVDATYDPEPRPWTGSKPPLWS